MKIKINSGFRFKQGNILKSHVDFCANKRKNCGNILGEKRAKDNSNIVFGKTIECVGKRNCIRYFSDNKKLGNFTSQYNVKNITIIHEDLVQVTHEKNDCIQNKPIQMGFTVLEHSKNVMLKFFFYVLIKQFGVDSVSCIYSDTDSFYLQILGFSKSNIFDMLHDWINFSNFEKTHPRYSDKKKFKLSYVKVDTKSKRISAFIGIKRKNYFYHTSQSIKLTNESRNIKLKGVKRSAFKQLQLNQYSSCILRNKCKYVTCKTFESKKHRLSFVMKRKLALNSIDPSQKYRSCNNCTIPFHAKDPAHVLCKNPSCELDCFLFKIWSKHN